MLKNFFYMPEGAAAHAAEIDRMIDYTHWLMLVLFVGWTAFFLYTLVRFRRSRQPRADYTGARSHASTWAEVAVAIVEVVLLVGFSIPLWADRVDERPPESQAVVVRVIAEQFAWNIHYPGADGRFGRTDPAKVDLQTNPIGLDRSDPAAKDDITTINQMHLPVGRPAIVHLSSKDVIHSFNLPHMRTKQDAIPGLSIPLWFVPTVTTEQMRKQIHDEDFQYEIACAQLCGLGHYRMRGFLTVHAPEAYEAWLAEQAAQLAQGEGQDAFWE